MQLSQMNQGSFLLGRLTARQVSALRHKVVSKKLCTHEEGAFNTYNHANVECHRQQEKSSRLILLIANNLGYHLGAQSAFDNGSGVLTYRSHHTDVAVQRWFLR